MNNLNENQLKLAKYMSALSEIAYTVSWMENLEFSLWKGMNNEIASYGRLTFTQEIRDKLKRLSDNIGDWIYFHDKDEEIFVDWKKWNELKK